MDETPVADEVEGAEPGAERVERGLPVTDVVIPVLEEEETLPELLERLRALPIPVRPIFVDNGSTDGTLPLLRAQSDVLLIEHGENLGYGASLKDGMAAAESEFVVIIDADLEFPPEEIPRIVGLLRAGADVVYASRFLRRQEKRVMPWFRIVGNRMVSVLFNVLYRQRVTDLYTGFKGLRTADVAHLRLGRDGFEHVVELAARLARNGARIVEVPMTYQLRRSGRSKMRHVSELAKFLWLVFRYRFDSRRSFVREEGLVAASSSR